MKNPNYQYHTVAEAFDSICNGKTEWMVIGNFLNDWWAFSLEDKYKLIETPLIPTTTPNLQLWAAFCAAMVEWLCEQEHISCPQWAKQAEYVLSSPWFYDDKWTRKAKLLATTPVAFKRRNIYIGNRMFLAKKDQKPEYTHFISGWAPEEMGLGQS